MIPSHTLAIDEEGYPLLGEARVTDEDVGAQILSSLQFAENGAFMAQAGDQFALVEAFDEPLVAQMVEAPVEGAQSWIAQFNYQVRFRFELGSLTVDEWDRFHGMTEKGIPFVFSRKAQAAFFDLLDEFDDESITFRGAAHPIHPWMTSNPEIRNEKYWSDVYRNETPGWELNRPAPALVDMLPRLKLPKSRVLVLGAGSGNDAAFFAEQGHVVTAVDFSPEAIARAQEKYGHLKNLKFVEKDAFALDSSWTHQFDLVFEHTCYCAIPPERRNDLIAVWRRVLVPGGQLLGVFFTMERRSGPPFGGTEWELRERLKKHFQFQFWGRWKNSIQRRNGKELFVFATKKSE
jgi:SAM-dependent methyltransferase